VDFRNRSNNFNIKGLPVDHWEISGKITYSWVADPEVFRIQNSGTIVSRIILRPLSALSLDEGLNALNGKTPSAAVWFRRPIKCQILARMRISDFIYFRL
jgi:hypothetical protein